MRAALTVFLQRFYSEKIARMEISIDNLSAGFYQIRAFKECGTSLHGIVDGTYFEVPSMMKKRIECVLSCYGEGNKVSVIFLLSESNAIRICEVFFTEESDVDSMDYYVCRRLEGREQINFHSLGTYLNPYICKNCVKFDEKFEFTKPCSTSSRQLLLDPSWLSQRFVTEFEDLWLPSSSGVCLARLKTPMFKTPMFKTPKQTNQPIPNKSRVVHALEMDRPRPSQTSLRISRRNMPIPMKKCNHLKQPRKNYG